MKKTWQTPTLVVHGDVSQLTLGCIITKAAGSGDDLAQNVDTVPGGVIMPDCPQS